MSGQGDEVARSGTTSQSIESGMGSTSLSDPFVAIPAARTTVGLRRRVKAPEGSSNMEVRRSSRVAAARAKPFLLPVAEEEPGTPNRVQSHKLMDPMGNAVGFRDTANPQLGLSTGEVGLVGRKRSASNAAPGSERHGQAPVKLASASDFPPGHFDEPNSDDHIPLDPPQPNLGRISPMKIDPFNLTNARHSHSITSPVSSTLSQNPLLLPAEIDDHTTSARRPTSSLAQSRDAGTAQPVMEGMFPIGEGFHAPGYAPVEGAAYNVQSPPLGRIDEGRSTKGGSTRSRRLFAEYTRAIKTGPLDLTAAARNPTLHAILQDVCIYLSQIALCIKIDSHIVRPAGCQPGSAPEPADH